MAELLQTSIPNIKILLKNLFDEGKLEENQTIKEFLIVQQEGSRRGKQNQVLDNINAMISVGYRIKSHIATRFRQYRIRIRQTQLLKDNLYTYSWKCIG